MLFNLQYIILGACVGFIVGLTGVGGGSLMSPALVLLFGVHPAQSVDDRPSAFRHRCIEKISAYRRRWVDPKEEH